MARSPAPPWLHTGFPSTLRTGMMLPAVVVMKTSSACANSSAWMGRHAVSILWRIPFNVLQRSDSTYWGAYTQLTTILTGEQRTYSTSSGLFGPVIPEKPFRLRNREGWGAVEVGARISHIDISDGVLDGGRETNLTLGANWYLNENLRIMTNYVHGSVERDGVDGSFDAVQMRLQIDLQPRRLSEFNPLPRRE